MEPSDFHVGQIVYVCSTTKRKPLRKSVVKKIGRKWIYLDDPWHCKLDGFDGSVYNGPYTPDEYVVTDPDEYYDLVDSEAIRAAILSTRWFANCNLDQLKAIADIAKIEYIPCKREFQSHNKG